MGVISIRNKFRKKYNDAKFGEVKPIRKCCREIRIQVPYEEGKLYHGYNTITETHENWLCLSVAKDYNNTQMQRVFYKETK